MLNINRTYYKLIQLHIVMCMPLIRRVLVQMIGFINSRLHPLLYGCETWSLTLREERRLRVFENRVSAVPHLHTLQYTVAHALGFSRSTSRLSATDLDAQTVTVLHSKYST
jgi:hypothetical protein